PSSVLLRGEQVKAQRRAPGVYLHPFRALLAEASPRLVQVREHRRERLTLGAFVVADRFPREALATTAALPQSSLAHSLHRSLPSRPRFSATGRGAAPVPVAPSILGRGGDPHRLWRMLSGNGLGDRLGVEPSRPRGRVRLSRSHYPGADRPRPCSVVVDPEYLDFRVTVLEAQKAGLSIADQAQAREIVQACLVHDQPIGIAVEYVRRHGLLHQAQKRNPSSAP